MRSRLRDFVLGVAVTVALSACAGPVERWIVNTRVHQGELALARGNSTDALLAYKLALRVDPSDPRAQGGFIIAAAQAAEVQYTKGEFSEALVTMAAALKIDPQSVRLQALRSEIEDAELKQEIVSSNYPAYRQAALAIRQSYLQLNEANAALIKSLKRFGYTYDVADLTRAIEQSYEMQIEVTRTTNRLISYRQLVQSGAPQRAATSPGITGSLLPLP